jgi:glutathione peroxidase
MAENVLDVAVKTADGTEKPLSEYKGNVLLVVNVASKCGNTPQYAGLEKLYEQYKDQGLVILGFPCNQFGGQEPGTMEEIQQFCTHNYGVTFPILNKIDVKGSGQAPLYAKLEKTEPAGPVTWNFEKFVVSKTGEVITRFTPKTKPEDPKVVAVIEQALKA